MNESGRVIEGKLMIERALPGDSSRSEPAAGKKGASNRAKPARSLSVNLAESPLGWL